MLKFRVHYLTDEGDDHFSDTNADNPHDAGESVRRYWKGLSTNIRIKKIKCKGPTDGTM